MAVNSTRIIAQTTITDLNIPTVVLNSPTDAQTISDSTPTLNFTGTSLDAYDLEYNIQVDTAAFDSWTKIGNSLTITGCGGPALAALSSTRVAFIDSTNEKLETYDWNDTDWTKTGNSLTMKGCVAPALAALSSTRVAFIDYAFDYLETYDWNGTDWTKTGNGLEIAGCGVPALAALSPTRVAFIDHNNDKLETYDWNGTDWTKTGNSLTITGCGGPALAALSPTRVAFLDVSNDKLETYDWNGTDWSKTGNSLTIAGCAASALAALSSTRVAFIDSINEKLETYDWNGTDWSKTGNSLTITGCGGPALAALSPTRVALIDPFNISLSTYEFSSTPLIEAFSATPDDGFAGGDGHPFTSGVETTYTIQAADELDPGTYYWRVRAIDPLGSNTWGAWSTGAGSGYESFEIPNTLPTLTSPTATNVSLPTATLGATITSDGGLTITARGTCWGTSPSPTTNALAEGGTSTGAFSHSRTGLTLGVIIYYRGYATNSSGTGYSEDGVLIPGSCEQVQYESDHETKIATGGSTTNTSVFLDFSANAPVSAETITPKVEVRAIGSSFTGTATHTGSAFSSDPGTPRFRSYPAVIYDSANKRLIAFGGKNDLGAYLNDTWELKIPTSANPNPIWRQMSPSGTPPTERTSMVHVYDSNYGRLVIFGGTGATTYMGGFFSLDLSTTDGTWSSFTPSGTVPSNRFTSAGIYDSTNSRMIVFGGYTGSDNNDLYSITLPSDLSNSASTQLSPGGTIPAARSEHSMIYDSANQRAIVFGGWGASFYNDVKVLSLTSGSEAWVAVTVNGTAPNVRSSHIAIYDSVNQRMVTGLGRYQVSTVWYSLNDIFSLSIPSGTSFTWTDNTSAAGSLPAKRHAAGVAYDSVNERAVIFGGFDRVLSLLSNETLVVNVSSSTGTLYYSEFNQLANLTNNDGSEAVYDSYNKQMVRFGGYGHIYDTSNPDGTGYHHSELWSYSTDSDLATYNYLKNITPSIGPLAGEVSAMIYDSNYRRIVRFGSLGYNQDQSLNDTWAISLDPARADYHIWKRITTNGGPPAARWGAANIFDPVNSRMIIFGGALASLDPGQTFYSDAWQLSLPDPDSDGGNPTYTWTQISASGPPAARFQSTAIYDPTNIRMVLFGGKDGSGNYLNDLWELNWDNGTPNTFVWTDRTPTYSPSLTGRRGQTTVYDATYSRMIMFGGWDGSSTHFNDVWSFDVSSLTVTATNITTSGTSPVVRRSHNAIFDPEGQRMIIQGGRGGLSPTNFLMDFWELSLPSGTSGWTWTQLSPVTFLKTSVSVPTLTNNTGYHWQAWSTGSVSGDTSKISYGGNSESVSDFIIGTLSFTTNIKTVDGLAFEYVKTMNGLIVASVKSIDGLE